MVMKAHTLNEIVGIFRKNAFKLTPQRKAVLKVITGSHDHLTPLEIYTRVKHRYSTIGLVTIYRTLEILAELNLVCRVHVEDNCRSFLMRRPSGHHHHLVCKSCGTVIDFTECNLDELEQRLFRETGFYIQSHLLEFNGRCQQCLEREDNKTNGKQVRRV
jgi:Fur family transcriptional regulator, ferric uptake regulator